MNQYKFKQNDLPKRLNSANGRNEHCFAVTLYVIACDAVNRNTSALLMPNAKTYEKLYMLGNEKKLLTDETGKQSHGAYVNDDDGFIQFILDYFNTGLKVHKTGSDADYLVINIKTENGGHFRELNYDPWYKEVVGKYVKSIRGYKITK